MSKRDWIFSITLFGSLYLYLHMLIHWWLGYPVFPQTTSNDLLYLTGLNFQMLGLALLFFIPALLLAAFTTVLLMGLLSLGRILARYGLYGRISSE